MKQRERTQLALDWPSQPSYLAGDFVVGDCNRVAYELLTRWPDWPHFAAALHGPSGAGKTHLAHIWAAQADAGFTTLAGLHQAGPQALAAARQRWVLELDTAAEALDRSDETALFHFHNLLHQGQGALLYVTRLPLARWTLGLADLHSRFAACPAVAVRAPDDSLLAAVMAKLASDRQITLTPDVVAFLLPRVERSFAAIAQVVHAIDVYALARRRSITPTLAGEVLKALAQDPNDEGSEG